MDVDAYIASGKLELYVAGQLNEEENLEVYRLAQEHPAIMEEILAIEAAILELSKTTAPKPADKKQFSDLIRRIGRDPDPEPLRIPGRTSNWVAYSGWAAALLLAAGLWWVYQQNAGLQEAIQLRTSEVELLEEQIFEARNSLDKTRGLLNTLRDRDIRVIALGGQDVAPDAFAKAYWNKSRNQVLIDAQGLPEPPPGMVYQVWSLKLSPLTPTSLGLLEDFATDENKVFALANPNESEAFGITLEPAGGSESPTLEQLYALGAVSS